MFAAKSGDSQCVRLLVEAGADTNVKANVRVLEIFPQSIILSIQNGRFSLKFCIFTRVFVSIACRSAAMSWNTLCIFPRGW